MIIPWNKINPTTLYNLIECFVLREGTDYGEKEQTLQKKANDIMYQIQSGQAILVWSEWNLSMDIIPRSQCFSD